MEWKEGGDEDIKNIIERLGWGELCAEQREVVLPLVKEFYANRKGMVNDKVFVRGEWIDFSCPVLNDLLCCPDHDEDDYKKLIEKGVDTEQMEEMLCQ